MCRFSDFSKLKQKQKIPADFLNLKMTSLKIALFASEGANKRVTNLGTWFPYFGYLSHTLLNQKQGNQVTIMHGYG